MKHRKLYYFSKGYQTIHSAGNKAKLDSETIVAQLGFKNLGVGMLKNLTKFDAFFVTLYSVTKLLFTLPRGSVLFMQYPLRKYYTLITAFAHLKQSKVLLLVHDLGSMRRAKVSVEKEVQKLSRADAIIIQNEQMEHWISENGVTNPIVRSEVWDYLSTTTCVSDRIYTQPLSVCYAGSLDFRKAGFLYAVDTPLKDIPLHIYGKGLPLECIGNRPIVHHGFIDFDTFIAQAQGSVGLVWDGTSCESCVGSFGSYLAYNTPHKVSLYIRAHLPIVIWSGAAMAKFVVDNGIGWSIDSLEQLPNLLSQIDVNTYHQRMGAICKMDEKIKNGHFLAKAITESLEIM